MYPANRVAQTTRPRYFDPGDAAECGAGATAGWTQKDTILDGGELSMLQELSLTALRADEIHLASPIRAEKLKRVPLSSEADGPPVGLQITCRIQKKLGMIRHKKCEIGHLQRYKEPEYKQLPINSIRASVNHRSGRVGTGEQSFLPLRRKVILELQIIDRIGRQNWQTRVSSRVDQILNANRRGRSDR